ncbi:MAG: hypothetical protein M3096_03330 [Actinomycetia bacterium]|nr:hypothetical protein [Actinomycetes bacterium]
MVPVYAIALFVGFLLLLAWIVGVGIGSWVEGWEFADPERRFGFAGRSIVAGLVGFGMAGMSASFGGWPPALAILGALAGAAAMVAVARVFGPDTV